METDVSAQGVYKWMFRRRHKTNKKKQKNKNKHAGVYHRATVGVYPRCGSTAVKFAEPEKNIQQQVMLRGHYTSE